MCAPTLFWTQTVLPNLQSIVQRAAEAAPSFRALSGRDRADFLRAIAAGIEALGPELIETAMRETHLPQPRLEGERARTCSQLRMFADLIEEGSWVDARVDTAIPDRLPLPKPDLRRMLVGLGPVAVFGASNFPLAFSTPGGDTASALAAGCPVVVKGHPAHPETSRLVAAVMEHILPAGVFGLVEGGVEEGIALVKCPEIQAVAFTGSLRAGRALFDACASRPYPIPMFAEMGSVNPVFLLPSALQNPGLAAAYVGSLTLGVGQFCTNPALVIGIGEAFDTFVRATSELLDHAPTGTMLTPQIGESYRCGVNRLAETPGVKQESAEVPGMAGMPAFFSVAAPDFLANPELAEEVFGPCGLAIRCKSSDEMLRVAHSLGGQLTATVHATEAELEEHKSLVTLLTERVGRLLFAGFPTGLEVCPSTHHGGPYPASTDVRFSSVGTSAILRFARPLCWQDAPAAVLPPALQNHNPLGLLRTVNGSLTREPV